MKLQVIAEVDNEKDTYFEDMKTVKAMMNVDNYRSLVWDLKNEIFREKLWGYFCEEKKYTEEQCNAALEIMEHYSNLFYEKLSEENLSGLEY